MIEPNIYLSDSPISRFLAECLEVYYVRLFIGPFLFMYSISFSIFGQMIVSEIKCVISSRYSLAFFSQLGYPSGYGFALCSYILLLIFCSLGENTKFAVSPFLRHCNSNKC